MALEAFAAAVEAAGADALIVHARKAWLAGPVAAREPRHPAARLRSGVPAQGRASAAADRASTAASRTVEAAREHLAHVDGVMMGRAAYQEPWRLLAVDPLLFGEAAPFASAKDAVAGAHPYIERELARGARLHAITRHLLGAVPRACPARAPSAGIWRRRR